MIDEGGVEGDGAADGVGKVQLAAARQFQEQGQFGEQVIVRAERRDISFVIAMTGIVLIACNGSFVLRLNPLGDLLSLLAALAWAFYSVLIVKIGDEGTGTLPVTRKVVAYGLIFTLPVLPLFGIQADMTRLSALPDMLNLIFWG